MVGRGGRVKCAAADARSLRQTKPHLLSTISRAVELHPKPYDRREIPRPLQPDKSRRHSHHSRQRCHLEGGVSRWPRLLECERTFAQTGSRAIGNTSRGHSQRAGYGIRCQVMSTFTGISFLMGTVKNDGLSILKSEHVDGMVPVMWTSLPCVTRWNCTWLDRKS